MSRELAEKIIGNALELIRTVCEAYYPEYDHCSMYVKHNSKSAFIMKDVDEDRVEYVLNYYEREDEKE